MSDPARILADGIARLGLACPPEAQRQLLAYVQLLHKWNKVYNLTAVRDPQQMVSRHLLDSLAVAPLLRGVRVIDVGTGAGLPGIPLAVLYPERRFVLLDAIAKKTRFVTQAVIELGLGNVTVEHTRVEDYHPAPGFDTVVSRAFSSLTDMAQACRHLCAPGGVLLAMKGVYPQEELQALPSDVAVLAVEELRVPGEAGARHAVIMAVQ